MVNEQKISATKKKGLFGLPFGGRIELERTTEEQKVPEDNLREPIALIIKDNFDVEILENVPEGKITIKRIVGNREEEVEIANPKSKLLSFPFANGQKRGWIIDEKEAVALPTKTKQDSLELKRLFNALVLNYKSIEEGASKNWWFWIIIAILGALAISAFMGISIQEMIFGKPAQTIVQVITDQNKQVVTDTAKNVLVGTVEGIKLML